MLNAYFAFGVPVFLLVLYTGFEWYRHQSKIDYLGFVLFIIAGFLTIFSFQVIQQALTEIAASSYSNVEHLYGYSLVLLGLPLISGIFLILLNIFRGYLRLRKFRLRS